LIPLFFLCIWLWCFYVNYFELLNNLFHLTETLPLRQSISTKKTAFFVNHKAVFVIRIFVIHFFVIGASGIIILVS